MAGQINAVVATLVFEGLRPFVPEVLPTPAQLAAWNADGAVPLEPYRQCLEQAVLRVGRVSLLKAGRSLEQLEHPLLFVLLNTDRPETLIAKEERLGAFIHSRHRVVLIESSEHRIRLEHVSQETSAPTFLEDLAGCGQHIVLFEEIGARGLRCRFPLSGDADHWVYERGTYREPCPEGSYREWLFEWEDFVPSRRPMAGLDEVLLAGDDSRTLREVTDSAEQVQMVLRRDLGRTWKLGEVAAALDCSPRSLQRRLGEEGTSFRAVVDKLRNGEAARLLGDTSLSLTEIGYVCGFADSAHFSRSFKKLHGSSPSEYRALRTSQLRVDR